MAKQFGALDPDLRDFIEGQQIFFSASAVSQSRVNISPCEISAFRVVNDNTVIYLDRTGNGNETAAHMLADGRMTIMFCAGSGPPRILRLFGKVRVIGWKTRTVLRGKEAQRLMRACPNSDDDPASLEVIGNG